MTAVVSDTAMYLALEQVLNIAPLSSVRIPNFQEKNIMPASKYQSLNHTNVHSHSYLIDTAIYTTSIVTIIKYTYRCLGDVPPS